LHTDPVGKFFQRPCYFRLANVTGHFRDDRAKFYLPRTTTRTRTIMGLVKGKALAVILI
jgi:hypothetical protein